MDREGAPTIKDPLVKQAVELFARDLGKRWTVLDLARELGTSRPALARRFHETLGRPPLRILREMRMNHAAHLLTITDDSLVSVADEVGYDSEFAFSRAFFRHFGIRPGRYRSERSVALGAPAGLHEAPRSTRLRMAA